MKPIYLIAFFSILLQSQSRIICWPLLVLAVGERFGQNDIKLFSLAFVLGLLTDLVSGRLLGETSLFLLLFTASILILKLRFKSNLKINLSAAIVFQIIYIILVNNLHF